MILVFGGAAQGKTNFARQLRDSYRAEGLDLPIYDLRMILPDLSKLSRQDLDNRLDYLQTELQGQYICIMEDMGCGLVPMDAQERALREFNGALLQNLASRATQVYRVFVGLGLCLKNEELD